MPSATRQYTKNEHYTKQLQEERVDFAGTLASLLFKSRRADTGYRRSKKPQGPGKKGPSLHNIEMPHVAVPCVSPDTSVQSIFHTPKRDEVRPFDSIFL